MAEGVTWEGRGVSALGSKGAAGSKAVGACDCLGSGADRTDRSTRSAVLWRRRAIRLIGATGCCPGCAVCDVLGAAAVLGLVVGGAVGGGACTTGLCGWFCFWGASGTSGRAEALGAVTTLGAVPDCERWARTSRRERRVAPAAWVVCDVDVDCGEGGRPASASASWRAASAARSASRRWRRLMG